ncbi:ATPase-stabilizing factor 15 kDa protein [Chaetomidium leptoderma]|uniref:ATPase-stabilizing factor 15 kDa protein n=1 Tax=Chaetomidium leptoderma TaxID=669021 RepID=A0AAN7A075_9PEZI|nr:ATPase-stabilizing factor 15 kDa protein [Chaetomidium leptoderma]
MNNELTSLLAVTRSHKFGDKDHAGLADGTVLPQDQLPKYFGKSGFADADPKKTKKNGGGRANWGNVGDEAADQDFNFTNARRRSNSSSISSNLENFKTKFEINEPEPVFEENMGPEDEEKTESSSATSVDEGKSHKEV